MSNPTGKGGGVGSGWRRPYSAAELTLFAAYRDRREGVKPASCNGGPGCWVEYGPPCYDKRTSYEGGSAGYGGAPNLRTGWR